MPGSSPRSGEAGGSSDSRYAKKSGLIRRAILGHSRAMLDARAGASTVDGVPLTVEGGGSGESPC